MVKEGASLLGCEIPEARNRKETESNLGRSGGGLSGSIQTKHFLDSLCLEYIVKSCKANVFTNVHINFLG